MFDEPEETPAESAADPLVRAKEKSDEFRMHAELVAVFEGHRKFDADLRPKFDADLMREIQKGVAKLEKSRPADNPLIPPASMQGAAELLNLPKTREISTNDYHIHRRPGEVMIVRFLAGDEVETFYERLQAHFDAALNQFREEEKQQHEWKQDPATSKYLEALDRLEVKMPERYLREAIRQHRIFILSTQTADEMDILHLCEAVMGVEPAELVGRASAPPDDGATEADRAWFFKLFSLRGMVENEERMCFFTYLQKAEETFEL
jgi:hypothetical protein